MQRSKNVSFVIEMLQSPCNLYPKIFIFNIIKIFPYFLRNRFLCTLAPTLQFTHLSESRQFIFKCHASCVLNSAARNRVPTILLSNNGNVIIIHENISNACNNDF